MKQVFVGLGGNSGDVRSAFIAALDQIASLPHITDFRVSKLYRTSPVTDIEQPVPDYLNCVCGFLCDLPVRLLFARLQAIETMLGRVRSTKHAPRLIDIDLLLYEGEQIHERELEVPHPRLFERLFVLVPLRDLQANISQLQETIETLEKSRNDTVIVVEEEWYPDASRKN